MNKQFLRIIAIAILAFLIVTVCLPLVLFQNDDTLQNLIVETLPRLVAAAILYFLMDRRGYDEVLKPKWRGGDFLWSIPCFLVAVVNFPFTALISGNAVIEQTGLVWLFLIKCLSIALLEELFFRGLLLPLALERFEKHPHGILLTVVTTSAIFSLMHIINLFFGAGLGSTALQLGYTFLLGCMFAVMFLKTKNVWLCVFVHAIFDVGGTIVTDLGHGGFQDMTFWILTAVMGVICTIYIVLELKKIITEKKKQP